MKRLIAAACLAFPAWPCLAQEASGSRLEQLELKIDALAEEVGRLRSEGGRAASKTTLGGYGEAAYQNFRSRRQDGAVSAKAAEVDLLRAVLYVGHTFSDSISFFSEIEFEHVHEHKRGEVALEQAYLSFRLRPAANLRAGLLLMPVGLINEYHEPTLFNGVLRPSVERVVLPSTWRENGIGLSGEAGPLSYRGYLVPGLQAVSGNSVSGFTASNALKDGRSSGSKSLAESMAFVGRLDAKPVGGLSGGVSVYLGQAGQKLLPASVPVTLWDVHAEWRGAPWQVRALYAEGRVGNVDALNAAQGIAAGSNASVGAEFFGSYGELAYDVLEGRSSSGKSLVPFLRYERYDTQKRVPAAWKKNPANSRTEYVLGLTYKPLPQVAVKADYQLLRNQARTGTDQWNLGVGYVF